MVRYLWNGLVVGCAALALITFGYPIAAMGQHGFNMATWPPGIIKFGQWFDSVASTNVAAIFLPYWQMARNISPDFAWGGRWVLALTSTPFAIFAIWLFKSSDFAPKRDPSGIYGNARWALPAEIKQMKFGLELGIDKSTGRTVRVSIEGNFLTIAPPRKGKTTGVLIPNLALPEREAWSGPAVVIDPKGEVFTAVVARRRQMGRTVRCLDPGNLVGGLDTWNPLENLDPNDIYYLQHTARVLLPESSDGNEAAEYFRNKAVDLIVGALWVALQSNIPSLSDVSRLLTDEEAFIGELKKYPTEQVARQALTIMNDDPKTRDPIRSTAEQAFSWLSDSRSRHLVASSSFELADLSNGNLDLFVAVRPRDKATLAPLLRWLLSDIFNAIRDHHPKERLVIFIDEAASLGRFDAILQAAGELPGHGASLWTIWQDRGQIVDTYGEAGAGILLRTAEIVTLFDVPAVDPDESERWSRAVGDFTALVETRSDAANSRKAATSTSWQAARLMTKEELTTTLRSNEVIVFPNSPYYARHPVRLRKTKSFKDRRFASLIQNTKPVGRA